MGAERKAVDISIKAFHIRIGRGNAMKLDDSKKDHIAKVYKGRHLEYMADTKPKQNAMWHFKNDFMKKACKEVNDVIIRGKE